MLQFQLNFSVNTGSLPMWCPACRADVAAELSFDSRHYRCARCGTELGTAVGSFGQAPPTPISPTDAERNARELLARWNAQNQWESPRSAAALGSQAVPPLTESPVESKTDFAETPLALADIPTVASETKPRRRRKRRRMDRSDVLRHREVESQPIVSLPAPTHKGNWGVAVGQTCAYFGIGLITCGTSVVLWGYFGGPVQLAPTGWLVTTVGQMFLFLGVVTLISSGMEQTTAEIATRIDRLGQQLIRIERRHRREQLTGPHHPDESGSRRSNSSSGRHEASTEPA